MSLLGATALGQSQVQQPFFTIRAQDADPKTIATDRGSQQLHFNVSVQPSQSGAVADQFTIRLDVAMDVSQVRNGFSAIISAPETQGATCQEGRCVVNVAPSQVVKFLVTITNTVTDPDDSKATVTLNYRSTPSYRGQPDPLNPVSGPIFQQMSQSHTASAKGTVDLKLDASEKLASFVKRYPLPILGVAGGILILGVVLVRKRRTGVSVGTESPVQEVLPGRGASFPLQVTNDGNQKETLSLTTSDVPPGWSAILPVERIELGPGETTTIWLTLKAPQNAMPGEHVQVNFVATSQEGASAESLVEAGVVERFGQSGPVRGPSGTQYGQPAVDPAPETAEAPIPRPAPRRRKA